MGLFNTFCSRDSSVEVQLKVGQNCLYKYVEGDYADGIGDGIYIGLDGLY